MTAVVFDPAAFKARYPEFSAVSESLLSAYFDEAGLYLSNADNSPVQNVTRRAVLLNMLTAHIAFLGGALSADGLPRPVGRVSSAAEGSVSASLEYLAPGTAAWFAQTQYGAASGRPRVACAAFAIFHSQRGINSWPPALSKVLILS